jgi:hypothetical protein
MVTIATDAGLVIAPSSFGQNYWDWVDWTDSGVTGLSGTIPLAAALHLNVIRAGGDNNDSSSPIPFGPAQIDAFVAYCQSVGAEPILQVPLLSNDIDGGTSTAQSAADMVTYANVTKGYGIRFWEIGNEPDLYKGTNTLSASAYCALFTAYATAMRAAAPPTEDGGPSIQILGPEISQPVADWLGTFLDGCANQVDIVTVHRYPLGPNTTAAEALADVTKFQADIDAMRAVIKEHGQAGAPFGITEGNLSWQYDPTMYTVAGLAAGPGSYPAALWTADIMGTALANGLWTFAFWNLGETSAADSVLGFINGGQPTPAYTAEELVSSSFRGSMLTPAGVPPGFSVYASHDPSAGSTSVLVLNKNAVSAALTFAVDALPPVAQQYPGLSMTLLQVPDAADAGMSVVQYTAELAEAGAAPSMLP